MRDLGNVYQYLYFWEAQFFAAIRQIFKPAELERQGRHDPARLPKDFKFISKLSNKQLSEYGRSKLHPANLLMVAYSIITSP